VICRSRAKENWILIGLRGAAASQTGSVGARAYLVRGAERC